MKELTKTNCLLEVFESNRFFTLVFIDRGTLVSLEITHERFRFSKKPKAGDSFAMFSKVEKDSGVAVPVYMLNERVLDGRI